MSMLDPRDGEIEQLKARVAELEATVEHQTELVEAAEQWVSNDLSQREVVRYAKGRLWNAAKRYVANKGRERKAESD